MFIRIYNTLISILYPLVIKRYIKKRQERGKEDVKRFNERVGLPCSNARKDVLSGFTGHRSVNLSPCCR